jgi:hypothetical protein
MTVVQWDRVGKGNLKENLEPSKGLEGNLKEICREKSFDVAQRLSSRCVDSSSSEHSKDHSRNRSLRFLNSSGTSGVFSLCDL